MSRPSLSVVVATRDRPQLLRRAVASILAQRYEGPIEVIAVFDQSEPDHDLVQAGTDRSVRVIRNTRTPGLPGGRNSGIAESTRDLIAFCDDDDLWLPGKVAAEVDMLEANRELEVVTTGLLVEYRDRVVPRVLDRERITFSELICNRVMEAHPSTYLAWRSAVEAIGPVDEEIPGGYAEDWDWLLRAARRADVGAVTLPLVKVFWHASSYFSERWQMIADATDYLLAKHPEMSDDPIGLANVLGLKSIALDALGRTGDGRDIARQALRLDRRSKRALVGLACSGPVLKPAHVMRVLQARGRGILMVAVARRPGNEDLRPVRGRWLPDEWPIIFMLAGYPVFWVLGAGAVVWPLLAVPMAARLLQRGRVVRVPRGFGWWLLFLVWMCLSFISLSGELPLAFLWRAASYFSATVTFIYVYNTPRERLPSTRLVSLLAGFWIITVAGGWLGVILPNGELTTPLERILPGSLVSHEFVQILVHPIFAQVQEVLGYPLGRPTAPFLYTNDWGGVYALTIPFFILGWLQSGRAGRRTMALLLLGASLVPALLSLNRGLWVSLLIALLFGATRSGDVGRLARRSLVAIVLVGLALIAFTPLKSVVEGRAEHQHSNEGREFLYVETVKAVADSPVIGYGGPRPYGGPKIIPNMGTQGQFWLVLFSQGVPGAFFFVAFLVKMTRATRRGPVVTFWCHVTLTIALVQIFVYDMIPVQLHLIMVVAALGCRDAEADRPVRAAA